MTSKKNFVMLAGNQLEDVMDWSAYIVYLQSILKEFDSVVAPIDDLLIPYFRDGLKSSIYA